MPTESDNKPINHPGGPNFSQKLWSEVVAEAASIGGEPVVAKEPSYEFSNGRRFVEPNRPV